MPIYLQVLSMACIIAGGANLLHRWPKTSALNLFGAGLGFSVPIWIGYLQMMGR